MNILIAGSSGFIGQSLCDYLRKNGHLVKTLVRRPVNNANEISWNPEKFEIPEDALLGIDAVINLCGRNISDWLWTPAFKQELFESRIKPTRTLAKAISKLPRNRIIFISTSGIGIYGAQRADLVTEDSTISDSFFAKLAVSWESEALLAQSNNHRVSVVRLGVVLGTNGGLVKKLSLIFKLGLGTKIGDGANLVSWIAIEDVCRAFEHILNSDNLFGPINLVNPTQFSADEFYDILARVFGRSIFLRIPSIVVRMILGEFAEEAILSSQRIQPEKLLNSGFSFTPLVSTK